MPTCGVEFADLKRVREGGSSSSHFKATRRKLSHGVAIEGGISTCNKMIELTLNIR